MPSDIFIRAKAQRREKVSILAASAALYLISGYVYFYVLRMRASILRAFAPSRAQFFNLPTTTSRGF